MVIIEKPTREDIALFEREVVARACRLTDEQPLLFAGPRGCVHNRSAAHDLYVFQYGQFFKCIKVINWATLEGESFYSCLIQVLLTLKSASEHGVLPTNMTAHHLLTGRGAAMIDIVGYLSAHFPHQDHSELLSTYSSSVASVCLELLRHHVPESPLISLLENKVRHLFGHREIDGLIADVSRFDANAVVTRNLPPLLSLSRSYFTFKEYLADIPNWVASKAGESNMNKCTAKILVHGTPARITASRFATDSCLPDAATGSANANCNYGELVRELVRNIILRLKTKILKDCSVTVVALDCTRGLTRITLKAAALSSIQNVDTLDVQHVGMLDKHVAYAHDSSNILDWAPVVKITKNVTSSPLPDFNSYYYKVVILLVSIDTRGTRRGSIDKVEELFNSVPIYCTTEY